MYRFQQGKWMLLTVQKVNHNRGAKKTKNEHWLKRQSSKAWIIEQQGKRDMQHMLFTQQGAIKF